MQQEVFDGDKLSRLVEKLPKGKPRIDAYRRPSGWRIRLRTPIGGWAFGSTMPVRCIFRTIRPSASAWRRNSAPSLKRRPLRFKKIL